MSKKDEALKLALEALEDISSHYMSLPKIGCMALAAIEEALAEQPAQKEPVALVIDGVLVKSELPEKYTGHLYTSPPAQRKPLTDEQIMEMYNEPRSDAEMIEFARAIEAAHGIKENT